jgi:IS30 family transposase
LTRYFYNAKKADTASARRRSESRGGIDWDPCEAERIIPDIVARLSRGQAPAHIWSAMGQDIPFSERTFYRHIERGCYGLNAFNLPRKVRYRPRKSTSTPKENLSLVGRTYADWCALSEEKRLATVQVDCIKGTRFEKCAILSVHFVLSHFQLYLAVPDESADSIGSALDAIETYCENEFAFSRHLGIILADRGGGFTDYQRLEKGVFTHKRTSMYYCDARHPEQKGACEKNTTGIT